ncbi:SDR family oxidoreductase [Candidatus Bipolaricaulota bacterium]|nr:SDR family oxidoreductase [Candidatus Bipolaricaulota bacterium]MCF7890336.1 SDR family oxidoreductase [Candidatus Bipolaricaulota bacterium]
MLKGKKILITGVRNKRSAAFWILKEVLDQGAEVVLTSPDPERTKRAASRVDDPPPVMELDVTEPGTIEETRSSVEDRWGELDGLVHSIAYADRDCIDPDFFKSDKDQTLTGFEISSFSLITLAREFHPLMSEGGSIVSLSFDTERIWPPYGWMNFFKVALEYFTRMLAVQLGDEGIRANSISAGTMKTLSARGIPGFSTMAGEYDELAPLDWDSSGSQEYVADACAWLLSDKSRMVTGEVVHVDGGANLKSGFGFEE